MTARAVFFPATWLVFFIALWLKAVYPAASGIADTDFFWHLAYGRWIIEHGALPAGDVFSWSMPGTPYRMTQWLGETIMGAAYTEWGLHGTKTLSVALAAVTIGFSWAAARRYVHTSVALGLALACNLIQIVTPMRPQLFTFALLAVIAYSVTSWLETRQHRYLLSIPPLMALWVNLHGGYVMGIAFLGLFCMGQWAEAWLRKEFVSRRRHLTVLTLACAAGVAATLVNPYGIGAWQSVVMIGGLKSSTVISEWMPVNLTTDVGWFYLLNLIPYVGLIIVSGVRPRLTHGLLAAFFLVLGILANRQVAICAAVMAPLTAALLGRTSQYAKMVATLANPSKPLTYTALAVLLLGAFPWIQAKGDGNWTKTINGQYPVNATAFMKTHGLTERVLSDTLEASYLIFAGVPVFIDGRMDLYRDFFFFDYYLASKGAPGWDRFLEKHRPQTLLLRNDVALRQLALATQQWRLVYEDDRYSLMVPATARPPLPAVIPRTISYLDQDGGMTRRYLP